ncbi:DUF4870 domain-containing protein [Oryzihumus leptocrescens]|uniref:Tic20 family protein n=1 Tax=Oryzihumus leptocrescens TaxID=297536 RepID=A0A542ZHF8_9MICO|nr:DUF4870 domain-containing protein [Oryzihumus leptocrescens]TQL59807.1 hypothetical protein FB474_1173 [Oryzihumus leptocrescens]
MTESPQDVPPPSQGQTPPEGGYPPHQPPQQQYPPPPAPYPGYAVQPPLSPGDARMWSIFAHLGGTFLSFIVPLVIYLVFKDRDPFVREHSSAALNFHLTWFIAYLVSAILILVLIGLVLIPLLAICALVFTIMAAVAANDGREYTYPLAIQFVR